MSLIAHWPLTDDLKDISVNNNHLVYVGSGSQITTTLDGKIGSAYQRAVVDSGGDSLQSTYNIYLDEDFTFAIWAKVTNPNGTANGLVVNHHYPSNAGAGISVRKISDTDCRIGCSTGTGTGRSYNTYYGTSNILGSWHHLVQKFVKSTNMMSLWVDGVMEKEWYYKQINIENKVGLFTWSIGYSNYKTAAIVNDARVYDHALSTNEIKKLAQAKVLHYSFSNLDEIIYDLSGYNRQGIMSPSTSPIYVEGGKIGKGTYKFEQQYVSLPNDCGYREHVSVFAWFKKIGNPGSGYHIICGGSQLEISIPTAGAIRVGITVEGRKVHNHGSGLTDGNWHHLGFTYNGSNKIAYIDGEEVGRVILTGTFSDQVFAYRRIGVFGSSTNYSLNGLINDYRIYATALSAEDIKELYSTTFRLDKEGNLSVGELKEVNVLNKTSMESNRIFITNELVEYAEIDKAMSLKKNKTLLKGSISEVD